MIHTYASRSNQFVQEIESTLVSKHKKTGRITWNATEMATGNQSCNETLAYQSSTLVQIFCIQ